MADTANADARSHETVAPDLATIQKVAHEFAAGLSDVKAAENHLLQAKAGIGARLAAACVGIKAVDEAQWREHWEKPVESVLLANGYKETSALVIRSNMKVAVIAITNGIAPNPDETFTNFVKRARTECAQREYIKTNGAGRKSGDGETKVTRKPSPRRLALELLARGGDQELPNEQVEKRVDTLSFLLSQDGIWEQLAALEFQIRQKLNKPKALAA